MNAPLRRRLGLMIGATAMAAAVCEIGARIAFPAPPDPTREPQIVYRVDPLMRYVLAENQRGWIDDGFVTTNAFGFRGANVDVPKPHGRFRIVTLGDSVAFGWGVNDGETFSAQSQALLRARRPDLDVELVNLAVPGYATRQEVELLDRHLARLQPDVVLVGFYSNDLPDTFEEMSAGSGGGTTIATRSTANGRILRMNPAPSSWAERQARRSRALYTATHALKQLLHHGEGKPGSNMELELLSNTSSPQLESAWRQIATQFGRLQQMAHAAGFSVGVVMLPPREQVGGRFTEDGYQSHVRALAEQAGFFVVDPLPSLAQHVAGPPLFVPYDRNHPSALGHKIIAEAVVDALERGGRVPGAASPTVKNDRN